MPREYQPRPKPKYQGGTAAIRHWRVWVQKPTLRSIRQLAALLRHRGHRIERREAVIQSMDIQLTLDWHSGYRRYPLGLELVIG
jgi:hypothetical protein